MNELRDLYQEVILDHNRCPQNFHKMDNASHRAEGFNPLCGDRIHLYLKVNPQNTIEDVSFEGSGCAISKASASMMSTALKGKTVEEAKRVFDEFHQLITSDLSQKADTKKLGKLAVFSGVREFPTRIKCAVLPWHTFQAALKGESDTVTTE